MYNLSSHGITRSSRACPVLTLDSLPAETLEHVAGSLALRDLGALRLANTQLFEYLSAMHQATRLVTHSSRLRRAAALACPTPPREFDALLESAGQQTRHVYRACILADLARALPGLPPDLRALAFGNVHAAHASLTPAYRQTVLAKLVCSVYWLHNGADRDRAFDLALAAIALQPAEMRATPLSMMSNNIGWLSGPRKLGGFSAIAMQASALAPAQHADVLAALGANLMSAAMRDRVAMAEQLLSTVAEFAADMRKKLLLKLACHFQWLAGIDDPELQARLDKAIARLPAPSAEWLRAMLIKG